MTRRNIRAILESFQKTDKTQRYAVSGLPMDLSIQLQSSHDRHTSYNVKLHGSISLESSNQAFLPHEKLLFICEGGRVWFEAKSS